MRCPRSSLKRLPRRARGHTDASLELERCPGSREASDVVHELDSAVAASIMELVALVESSLTYSATGFASRLALGTVERATAGAPSDPL
jgi:hypothetical protein